jgi:VanZ family protein
VSVRSRWAPPALWAALLFISSHIRFPPGPALFSGADKVAHFALYAVLATLVWRAIVPNASHLRSAALWSVLLTVAYGALDELHQRWVPGRECSFPDWLADLCGALAAVALAMLVSPRRRDASGAPPAQAKR